MRLIIILNFLILFFVNQCIAAYTTISPTSTSIPYSEKSTQFDVLNNIDKWTVTKFNVKKFVFSWTLINFSFHGKRYGQEIESPVFSDDFNSDYKWSLKIKPKYDSYMSINLYLNPYNEAFITSRIALLQSNNELYYPKEAYVGNVNNRYDSDTNSYYRNFIPLSQLEANRDILIPDDKLTIVVEIGMNVGTTNSTGSCGSPLDKSNDYHIDNLETLLEDEIFTDITFKITNHEFKAHRAILASVSTVLHDEFLKDNNNSVIEINNVEPKVFKELLRFAYTGKVENLEKNAKKLLLLAQKYNISQLEKICERALCQNINSNNAMDFLQFATSNNATYLKIQALKYISTHAQNMIDTPSFVSLISEPQNLISVIKGLINKS